MINDIGTGAISRLGFREGDRIYSVNGVCVDSEAAFVRTLLANAGADHGVRVGYIAVNENGLVGRVVSVGRRSARVLMLDDYNSRIPVMGEASRVRAVFDNADVGPVSQHGGDNNAGPPQQARDGVVGMEYGL